MLKLSEFITSYLAYVDLNCSPASVKRYRGMMSNLRGFCEAEQIGDMGKFGARHAEMFKLFRTKDGAAPRTINSELVIIGSAFNYFVSMRRLRENPWQGCRKLRVVERDPRVYSRDEIARVCARLPGWASDAVIVLVYTGLRFDELRNLRWAGVNLKSKFIRIASREGFTTKTGEAWTVPLPKAAMAVLKRRKKLGDEWVVRQPGGRGRMHDKSLRDLFQGVLKALGLEHGTIHDLRHTYASWMIAAGAPLDSVQAILGHRDYRTTQRYRHFQPDYLQEHARRLDD